MHACFDFRMSFDSPQFSPCQNVFSLQSIAASIGISNFFRAFFLMVSFNSPSSGSIKVDASQFPEALSSFGFSMAHCCLFLSLNCFVIPDQNFCPQMIRPCCCLNFCKPPLPDHINSVRRFSCNIVNCAKLGPMVHDKFRSASMVQSSSFQLSCNTCKVVCVLLITSMNRSGTGMILPLGTKSQTLGST